MSRSKGERGWREGEQVLELANGLRKGLRKTMERKRKTFKQREARTLGRNGTAPGNRDLLPPLLPLAAKQSVKARFLYYRRLIGFLKVKCTSASSPTLNSRDEGVGRTEDDAGRLSRALRGER